MLWLRTALFTLVVPGTVLVLVPGALLASGFGPSLGLGTGTLDRVPPARARVGGDPGVFRGVHTAGPRDARPLTDPPRDLVVTGLYHHVRNPQYVGVFFVAIGEVLLSDAAILLGYAALLTIAYHLLVTLYEEPTLGKLFGESYDHYREAVPRWLPRRPHTPGQCG